MTCPSCGAELRSRTEGVWICDACETRRIDEINRVFSERNAQLMKEAGALITYSDMGIRVDRQIESDGTQGWDIHIFSASRLSSGKVSVHDRARFYISGAEDRDTFVREFWRIGEVTA